MIQVRHLMIGLASSSAFYSGFTPALGLGDISLHSALNQPLNADIQLHDVKDLTPVEFKIKLASPDVYQRSGVDRLVFLNNLRFTPIIKGNQSIIRVTSSEPVREPYLNFIVEVSRPNGQLLREYTVLLDPPGTSAYRTAAAVPATQNFAPRPAVRAQVKTEPRTVAKVSTPAIKPSTVIPSTTQGKYHVVSNGDSLWKIAGKLRAGNDSINQYTLMRDIFALNPQAFANGNPDLLRAGVLLALPDSVSVRGAVAEADSTQTTKTATPAAPTQALADSPASTQPAAAMVESTEQVATTSADSAVPVAPADVSTTPVPSAAEPALSTAAGVTDTSINQLIEQQSRVEQELASRSDENLQMQQGLAEMQVQMAKLQAQVSNKDKQLAALQARLDAQAAAQPAAVSSQAYTNWMYAGLGGLGVLLLAAFGWSRRRQQDPQASAKVGVRGTVPAAAPLIAAPVAQLRPVAAIAEAPASKLDPLEGANLYIAYGRLPEAESALRHALEDEPQRVDLRFRLLEILAQMGSAKAFFAEEFILRAKGYAAEPIDNLKATFLQEAVEPEPVDEELVAQLPVATEVATPVDNFQLNLDDLSLDDDWDEISPFEDKPNAKGSSGAATVSAKPHDDMSMGLDACSPFAEPMLVEESDWLDDPVAGLGGDLEFDDFLEIDAEPTNVAKLNQALAYIEQGSLESACSILRDLINGGDELVKKEARELLSQIA